MKIFRENSLRSLLAPLFALSFIFLGAAIWTGCSSTSVNEADPAALYDDAEKDIKNDRYLLALDKLRILKSKFSYSSFGVLAQLRIGDVYFLQESYPEASAAFETFIELYPKHPKASYALFKAGESYYLDIPSTIARDLKTAESAINSFTQYLKKYPTGEFVEKAKDMKLKAYNKLGEKELSIAEFYIRKKKDEAAIARLQKVINQYCDSESATKAKELLKNLGK